MTEYKNIKVDPETFELLRGDKDDGVTWSYYLNDLYGEAHTWNGEKA